MVDLFAVSQRIPTYYSVFLACLKLICNILSIYQRTSLISHTWCYTSWCDRALRDQCNIKSNKISSVDRHQSFLCFLVNHAAPLISESALFDKKIYSDTEIQYNLEILAYDVPHNI